ncbi:hypothetical protein BC829DRAFT_440033 [Chytridium lagenaria]|nr:hypothetical protein BC829DRAFT_440033 [Chytridium lagenaria]
MATPTHQQHNHHHHNPHNLHINTQVNHHHQRHHSHDYSSTTSHLDQDHHKTQTPKPTPTPTLTISQTGSTVTKKTPLSSLTSFQKTNAPSPPSRNRHRRSPSICLDKAISLPLHQDISKEYMDSSRPLLLQTRVSLFDLETNSFFGRTWVDPMQYDLRNLPENHVQWEPEDGGGNETVHKSGSRSMKKPLHEGSEDDDSHEEDDEESNEDDDDNDTDESSDEEEESDDDETLMKKQHIYPNVNPKTRKSNKKIQKTVASQPPPFKLPPNNSPSKLWDIGVTVDLAERTIWMHTNRTSDLIIAVIEYVVIVEDMSPKEPTTQPVLEEISCGWTFFPLFNPDHGGLDPFSTWSQVDSSPPIEYSPHIYEKLTLPIYVGSPRSLLFIGPFLKDNLSGYPLLIPIPNASITFCENIWISAEDDIPGIQQFEVNTNGSILYKSLKVKLSKINISIYPSVRTFESEALHSYITSFNETFPNTLHTSPTGNLSPPKYLSHPPTIIPLHPLYTDPLQGDAFHLIFNGNIELEKYLVDPNVAVVAVLDYRIALKKMLGPKVAVQNVVDVERVVTLGWFVWTPQQFQDGETPVLCPVITGKPLNPYSTLILTPDVTSLETPNLEPYAQEFGRIANKDVSLCLSYTFQDASTPERRNPTPSNHSNLIPLLTDDSPPLDRALTPRPVLIEEQEYNEEEDISDELLVPQHVTATRQPDPVPVKRELMSRSERARLVKAGFEGYVDEKGEKVFVVNAKGREGSGVNWGLERGDERGRPNVPLLQFRLLHLWHHLTPRMAIYTGPLPIPSQNSTSPRFPRSASLPVDRHTRHPSHTSFRSNIPTSTPELPGILYQLDDNGAMTITPGTTKTFSIDVNTDPTPSLSAHHTSLPSFLHYLGFHSTDIDIWDGDSMLHLGVSRLDLRHCLRQGQGGVMAEYDVDIMAEGKSVGRLYVRVVNVGRKGERKVGKGMFENRIVRDFRGSGVKGEVMVEPKRMMDVDTELSDLLRLTYEDRRQKHLPTPLVHLQNLEKVKQHLRRNKIAGKVDAANFSYQMTRQDRQRDLETIGIFRERRKPLVIEEALAVFFEFGFTNPYEEEHLFEISWADDELSLPTEWFSQHRNGNTSAAYNTPSIFLHGGETISIPFLYQTFIEHPPPHTYKFHAPEASTMKEDAITPKSRTIKVSILNQKHIPVSLLDVNVIRADYAVSRTFRFFRPENENFRQKISAPLIGSDSISTNPDFNPIYENSLPFNRYIRCSNQDLLCTFDEENKPLRIKEFLLKCRTGSSMSIHTVHILLYYDPFLTSLAEIWRIHIHALSRLDVTCVLGQSNATSLVVRGSSFTRIVTGCSSTSEVVVSGAPFSLVANVLNEVTVNLKPRSLVERNSVLNFFDAERRILVSSWMIVTHCTSPPVTKSFEISLPRNKAVNKRVSYKNPYPTRKIFHLQTNADDILQFRDGRTLELEAGASQYISFRFLPIAGGIGREVLVFLNDENDKIEECLRIGIKFT